MFGMLAACTPAKESVTNVCAANCDDSGGEIPEEKADVPERVLDVVAEDPEEEHVAEDVRPAGVHEHPREDALVPGQGVEAGRKVAGPVERARVVAVAEHVDRHARPAQLPEPDEEVRNDQADRDVRGRATWDAVAQGKHRPLSVPVTLFLGGGERLADAVADGRQLELLAGHLV
jgi:hypothetical protein